MCASRGVMSDRISKTWTVLRSYEITTRDYCVDLFIRKDGSFGFEEFRRDTEDMGKWTGLKYYSVLVFKNEADALQEAKNRIAWLSDLG